MFAELAAVSVPSELMVKMLTVPEPLLTAYRYLPSLEAASEAGPLPLLKLPVGSEHSAQVRRYLVLAKMWKPPGWDLSK